MLARGGGGQPLGMDATREEIFGREALQHTHTHHNFHSRPRFYLRGFGEEKPPVPPRQARLRCTALPPPGEGKERGKNPKHNAGLRAERLGLLRSLPSVAEEKRPGAPGGDSPEPQAGEVGLAGRPEATAAAPPPPPRWSGKRRDGQKGRRAGGPGERWSLQPPPRFTLGCRRRSGPAGQRRAEAALHSAQAGSPCRVPPLPTSPPT